MFIDPAKTTPLVQRVLFDFEHNFRPRREVCITITVGDMREIMLQDDIGKMIQRIPSVKFYIRQLFLNSLIGISIDEVRRMTANITMTVMIYKEPQIRNLLTTIQLHCILCELSESELDKIAMDDLHDDYCRQIAFDEAQRRSQLRRCIEQKGIYIDEPSKN